MALAAQRLLRGRPRALRRVAVVEDQRVPVGVGEDRLVAHAAVDRVAPERDPLRRELFARRGDVVDLQRDPGVAGLELYPEGVGLDEREREVARLQLAGGQVAPALDERE